MRRDLPIELSKHGTLPHKDRFVLLMSMLRSGCTDEEVHEVFSKAENYDHEKTQYFIRHARKTYDTSTVTNEQREEKKAGPWRPDTAMQYVGITLTPQQVDAVDAVRGYEPFTSWVRNRLYEWMLDTPEPLALPDGHPTENASKHVTLLLPGFMVNVIDDVRGGESRSSWLRRFLYHLNPSTDQ